ncbi:RING finger protein 112-like isoform X1 [Aquarana catesbeiana]|uniref:RING finger protein 112-like isoform X1 n=1 Tax=Aquarana catesbeiana TaxID=8400 RepID=UPI003CC98B67
MRESKSRTVKSDMWANMDRQDSSSAGALVICDLCAEDVEDYMYNPCKHVFCWPCITKYRATPSFSENKCPTCYFNQPLQLVSVNRTGQLHLNESAVKRCFLECDDRPVYVISVIGKRRTGKSLLMNCFMRALRNMEKKIYDLGEDEPLNGFPWRFGTDIVTEGIWIWGKPFLLENNGEKMAIFLLDTEGTEDKAYHEMASMKLHVLTMMISSHLVYNVKGNLKETDINYLEIYCDPLENDPFHPFFELKFVDVLVRDRPDGEEKGEHFPTTYIKKEIQKLGRRDMKGVLNMVEERTVRCFLMPYPGNAIVEGERARLRDMNEDFKRCLKMYLLEVGERTQHCTSVMTCRKMAKKLEVCMEYVQNERYFLSPLELCNQLKIKAEMKADQEMERMKTEFQTFLKDQTQWRLPKQTSTLVTEKVLEILKTFHELPLLIRYDHHHHLLATLMKQLQEEGDKFCATHKKHLWHIGMKTAVHMGLAAAVTVAAPLLLPAAVPAAAAGGWFSSVGGWFAAAPAAPAATWEFAAGAVAGGGAMLQAGAAFVLRRFW